MAHFYRKVGQGYELKVALPKGKISEAGIKDVWAAFHKAHAAEYGHAFENSPIEIVNVRVSGIGRGDRILKV